MKIKRATERSITYRPDCPAEMGFGQGLEGRLHDKFGVELSPDAFLRREGKTKRERKPITLPAVSILRARHDLTPPPQRWFGTSPTKRRRTRSAPPS